MVSTQHDSVIWGSTLYLLQGKGASDDFLNFKYVLRAEGPAGMTQGNGN